MGKFSELHKKKPTYVKTYELIYLEKKGNLITK